MNKYLGYAIGVDLGGTFVKGALVAPNGRITLQKTFPIPHDAPKEKILDTIEELIAFLVGKAEERDIEVLGIGIGTPGIVYDGIVHGGADNLNDWENLDLSSYYNSIFNLPVCVENDANVMAIGELHYGAAKGFSDVIFLTIGTGIGGATIINGSLYGGYQNKGTEFGHIVAEHNGPDCNCGGKGCLEGYASTAALVNYYASLLDLSPQSIDGKYIVEKYHKNQEAAIKAIKRQTEYLGRGLAGLINVFAPQKVVIGGGISAAGDFFIKMIADEAFDKMMPNCGDHTQIVSANLDNRAGCLGAAALILENDTADFEKTHNPLK